MKNRRSIRLKGYDYSRPGAYFVTVCTQDRQCLFGDIADRAIRLSDAGRMVEKWYGELEKKFPDIECDRYVVMPNHFHAIIQNVGADLRVCPNGIQNNPVPFRDKAGEHIGSPLQRVVQWLKTMTTNEYIRCVKYHGWPRFAGKLWQRNYYEHVVRNEDELTLIREYILTNPARWDTDPENPEAESFSTDPWVNIP